MAALQRLVEPDVGDAHGLHPGRHLARLHGPHPVIGRGGPDEGLRVVHAVVKQVVRRERPDELPLLGHVRVAVFGDPGVAGGQLGVAAHVQQRHPAGHGAEQLRVPRQHVAHQQPAVGAAHAAEPLPGRDAARDQVPGHGREVLVRAVAVLLQRGAVPGRPVLAAAADVRHHVDAAAACAGRSPSRRRRRMRPSAVPARPGRSRRCRQASARLRTRRSRTAAWGSGRRAPGPWTATWK